MTVDMMEKVKTVGCLAPVSISTGTAVGKPINCANYNRVRFTIYAGVIGTSGNAITVEKGTSVSLGTAIAYNYRISTSGAAAYSEMDGVRTSVANTGYTIADGDDGKVMIIDIEVLPDLGAAYPWVGVKIGANAQGAVFSITADCYDARYMQTSALPTAIA